ncbi:MAG: hypothetical protein KF729_33465 [Sandaracinaceae bacterium]|nr:hypothetical protein [Sandaracinaceae bacterium]
MRLGDPSQAAALHDELLELDPLDVRALEQGLRLAEAREEWSRVAELHDRLAELATDARTRLAHLLALAAVCEDRLADARGALAAARRALAIDPAHEAALALAARLT